MFLFHINMVINKNAVVGEERDGKKFENTNLCL